MKAHPFFKTVDFTTLRQQPSPYVPEIKHATDTSNFDPIDACRLQQKDQAAHSPEFPNRALVDFTFHRFFDECGHPVAPYYNVEESEDVKQVNPIDSIGSHVVLDQEDLDADGGVYV